MTDPRTLMLHENASVYASTLEILEHVLDGEEEDAEKQRSDPLALQAMESSFFQVLNKEKDFYRGTKSLRVLSETNSESRNAIRSNVSESSELTDNRLLGSSLRSGISEDTTLSLNAYISLFQKGVEDADKFLPREISLTNGCGTKFLSSGRKGKRDYLPLQVDLERNAKDELSELFDRLFLRKPGDALVVAGCSKSSGRRKRRNKAAVVDLEALVKFCARTASSNDQNATEELLKQIREHASAIGDAPQRCAYYFANALEARQLGKGPQISASETKLPSDADLMNASKMFNSACPFRPVEFIFTKQNILNLVDDAHTLHIIDVGIHYGLRWVDLIADLSARPGGIPMLRITGIEHPGESICPAEMANNTGCRLAKYAAHFNVPFKYNGITARKWETIRVEDLEIDPNEKIAVTCTMRMEKLLGVAGDVTSPRSVFLDLIRCMSPDIFIHTSINGSFNVDTFFLRFQEALHHYSRVYDMFDAVFNRDCEQRQLFERYAGGQIVNIVACEGSERVERAETYRQWERHITRAGFRQLAVDMETEMRTLRSFMEASYHRDFLIENDGHWLLQGWKGKIFCATTCWIPA